MARSSRKTGLFGTVSLCVTLITTVAIALASNGEEEARKLPKAEAQLRQVYKELASRLGPTQRSELSSAQKTWENYRALALDAFIKETNGYGYSGEIANDEFSAFMVWSRVGHLNRMLAQRDLTGSESDFRDADDTINKVYKDKRRLLWSREPFEALIKAERAWIHYRDAAAKSESSGCSNPESAMVRVKTELTYERASSLRACGFRLSQRLSSAPPDLEKELRLAQLLSENADIRRQAVDYFRKNARDSLPLLIAQLKIGMLPADAAPVFEALGADAIRPLLEVADSLETSNATLAGLLAAAGPAVLPELVMRVEHSAPATFITTCEALADLGAKANDALPSLLEVIGKPERSFAAQNSTRAFAAQAALRIAPANPDVTKTIVDGYRLCPVNDEAYTNVIGRMGRAAKGALPTLIKNASGPTGSIWARIAIADLISPEDADLIPSLLDELMDPDADYWSYFRRALAKMGAPAAPPLKKLLHNQDMTVVRRAASTLVSMKPVPDGMVTELISLSQCEDAVASAQFIAMLGGLHDAARDAVPTLLKLYRSNRPGIRVASLYALHAIAPELEDVMKVWAPEPFVTDPYCDAGCYAESDRADEGPHYAFEADFNNDGLNDVAISDTSFGTGGGAWVLYLKVAEHRYKKLGVFGAPRHIALFKGRKGVGFMGIYSHMSASTGVEELLKITMDDLKEEKSVAVEWDSNDTERTLDRNDEIPEPKGCVKTELDSIALTREVLFGK